MGLEDIAKDFFGNSPEIQVAFITGYLSYRVSSVGLDRTHKAIDVIFQTLTYGLIFYVLYIILHIALDAAAPGFWKKTEPVQFTARFAIILLAVCVTFRIAVFWRARGRDTFVRLIQKLEKTRENFAPSTWDNILDAKAAWTYVSVTCDDGKIYESNIKGLPGGFSDSMPFKTLDVDRDGSIGIYVTRTVDKNGAIAEYEKGDVLDAHNRAHILYISASSIKRIAVSFEN